MDVINQHKGEVEQIFSSDIAELCTRLISLFELHRSEYGHLSSSIELSPLASGVVKRPSTRAKE